MPRLTLFPHQEDAVHYLEERGSGFLYMLPRLGKSLSALRSIGYSTPTIIICPSTIMAVWEENLIQEGFSSDDIVICDDRHRGFQAKDYTNLLVKPRIKFAIINIEKVVKTDALRVRLNCPDVLGIEDWRGVIFDESILMSNMDSLIGDYCGSYPAPTYQRRVVLSGYPTTESSLQLANPAFFIDGEYFGCNSPQSYRRRYWKEVKMGNFTRWVIKSKLHLAHIKQWVKDNTFQKNLEDLNLGGKALLQHVKLPMDSDTEKLYKYFKGANTYTPDGSSREVPLESHVRNLFLHKICNGMHPLKDGIFSLHKYFWVRDFIKGLGGEKVLILARFNLSLRTISKVLNEAGVVCEIITGDTSLSERSAITSRHRSGVTGVVAGQVECLKMGLDYSHCNYMVYFNNGYSLDARLQSVERLQNLTRSDPYEVIDVSAGQIEADIYKTLVVKEENVTYIMED